MKFDATCNVPNQAGLANYGKRWAPEEVATLARLLDDGRDMNHICSYMQRPADGVYAKAMSYKMIVENMNLDPIVQPNVCQLYYRKASSPVAPTEEQPMSTTLIETVTLINGKRGDQVSDKEIFNKIAELENEYASLDKINHKPAKLLAVMEKIQFDIAALATYVDGRP